MLHVTVFVIAIVCCFGFTRAQWDPTKCSDTIRTDKGDVCGVRRLTPDGSTYVSFRGVPYAKQPVGPLRFQELQPADPWSGTLDASEEGPVCPQYDTFYEKLSKPNRVMSEACIYANIHVPTHALLRSEHRVYSRSVLSPDDDKFRDRRRIYKGLPVLVYVHGGGFAFGSGDSDYHGPEYLIPRDVIVITFNYRLNVFGFLSLNSTEVPGNNGIRDVLTLLRWVQANVVRFGGNPRDVTLAGQSAGAIITHLVAMSPARDAKLFKRIMILSGTASQTFYSASPVYAKLVADLLLKYLNINSTDPAEVHKELVEMPLEAIMAANQALQEYFGVLVFSPVVETFTSPYFSTIIDKDPDQMIKEGRALSTPVLIGSTSVECETFRPLFERINIVDRIKKDPKITVYSKLLTSLKPEVLKDIVRNIQVSYYQPVNMDNHIQYCSDAYFIYPAIKFAKTRAEQKAIETYMYQFSYNNPKNVLKTANHLKYYGAAHVEDQSYILRINTGMPPPKLNVPIFEDPMVERMTNIVSNFIHCSNPTCTNSTGWEPVNSENFSYQDIRSPDINDLRPTKLTDDQTKLYRFFCLIENIDS